MKEDSMSFNAQVGIRTDFLNKVKLFFIFLSVLFFSHFSAQEVKSDVTVKSDAVITVVGDAFIYSKDASFNEQVSKNKNLQQNSNIESGQNNDLKISAKDTNKIPKELNPSKKKLANVVLAAKKIVANKTIDFPKKEIQYIFKNLNERNQFLSGSGSGNISFVFPNNDFHLAKYFVKPVQWLKITCIKFSDEIIYFYTNDNSKLQVFHNDYSVRPPPSLI